MKNIPVIFSCCLCEKNHKAVVVLPDRWAMRYDGIDKEDSFCPEHALIAEWADAQCPGCVEGWMDCGLWRDFAYSRRDLSESDFAAIEAGICPRRTNGSMMVNDGGGIETLNLSEKATSRSGKCLAAAIMEYWKHYAEHYRGGTR
jgi:hypothetical protein